MSLSKKCMGLTTSVYDPTFEYRRIGARFIVKRHKIHSWDDCVPIRVSKGTELPDNKDGRGEAVSKKKEALVF